MAEVRPTIFLSPDSRGWRLQITDLAKAMPATGVGGSIRQFLAVSEAAVNTKLSPLQPVEPDKGE